MTEETILNSKRFKEYVHICNGIITDSMVWSAQIAQRNEQYTVRQRKVRTS